MTTLDTIITSSIAAQLDDLAASLANVPGRVPDDTQNAATLLAFVLADLYGHPSRLLLNTLERRGVDAKEAQQIARALRGVALRLGAWLGRGAETCGQAQERANGAKPYTE